MKNKLIDTHCHLASKALYSNAQNHIDRAKKSGVTRIIVPATNGLDFEQVLALKKTDHIYSALGIHPCFITENWQNDLAEVEKHVRNKELIAIGEIGLDFYDKGITEKQKNLQVTVFSHQLQLAQKYDLPVLLHNRKSIYKMLELLKNYPVKSGIAHAFSGSLEEAHEFLKLNIKLGIGTMLCRPNTPKLSKLAQNLPNNAYVLETDSPDMPPIANTINYPENTLLVAEKLAELRNQPLEAIIRTSTENAKSILAL